MAELLGHEDGTFVGPPVAHLLFETAPPRLGSSLAEKAGLDSGSKPSKNGLVKGKTKPKAVGWFLFFFLFDPWPKNLFGSDLGA